MKEHHGSPAAVRPVVTSPALTKALDHWESIRTNGGLPARTDLDPMAIHRLLSAVLLIDVHPDDRFVYRLAGQLFEDRYQMGPLAGKSPEDVLGESAEKVLAPYRLVRDTGCVFYRDSEVDWLQREPSFRAYKALLLPFAADGETVDAILGAFDFTRR